MKYLYLLAAFPLLAFSAPTPSEMKKMLNVMESVEPKIDCAPVSVAEMKTPKIKKGEVKLSFDCKDFPTPAEKVEREVIKFYSDSATEGSEFTIRSRADKDDSSKKDVTVKFRTKDETQKLEFEESAYDALKNKSDLAKDEGKNIELKCEADVTSGPTFVNSCSLTTTTDQLTPDHQAFAQMVSGKALKTNLTDYTVVQIDAESWKISNANFAKGISVEKWMMKKTGKEDLCMLEVSAKFEVSDKPITDLPDRLKAEAKIALEKLQAAFPSKALVEKQGNKTRKALDFAK